MSAPVMTGWDRPTGSLHFLLRAFGKFNTGNSPSSCRQAIYQMALYYNFADVMQGEIQKTLG